MFVLALGGLGLSVARGQDELFARIKSDRVNLRARADSTAEVVAQVTLDERLRVLGVQEDWVQVVPPDRVDLWVHRDFIKEGLSVGEKVNVRAGAGINFSVVGQYTRGERVDIRGQFGEWLKVAPSNSALWINREYVDLLYPAQAQEPNPAPVVNVLPPAEPLPVMAVTTAAVPAVGASVSAPPRAAGAEAPRDLKLVPLEGQGQFVQRTGELKPTAYIFGRPSKYRLARREGTQYVTICYVRGNSDQLKSLLNQTLIVSGREYWVQGVRQPVMVLERIERPVR